jgi:hypothetical protein
VLEQLDGLPAVVGHERDTDARRDHQRSGPEGKGPAEARPQALGDPDRERPVGIGEEDAELVPADAGDDVAGADGLLDPRRRQAQQFVPVVVPERVVGRPAGGPASGPGPR